MRAFRPLALTAGLAALLLPELPRYAAERRLGAATRTLRVLLGQPRAVAGGAGALERVAATALSSTEPLPGDPRPWVLAGSAWLLSGNGERALEAYREAFSSGERAEIDLNLARAYAMLQRGDSAEAALLRAVWISPALLASLPAEATAPLRAKLDSFEAELRLRRLEAPPPLPPEERR